MNVSAKVDYAIRALVTIAAAGGGPVKAEALAASQDIPVNFLENILGDLRRAGVVATLRGAEGGYRLARPASEITLADVIRPLDGPLAAVRGVRPEAVEYAAPTEHLQDVWVAVRASLRSVLEAVTVQDVATGRLPRKVARLTESEDAWAPH
ncbi:MAG TPA: Rrf2 family transcriptional regulator [Acidimicrobiales bacterium]|nr:Rrf2 family transcriptional regulator [Acidimicrobiales bacterium]